MDLTCPKCHGTMRTYERNGVHVDQCSDCRGIFLDRGELDRLIDAENAWHGGGKRPDERHDDEHRREHEPRREHESSGHGYSSGHQSASTAGLGSVVGEVLRQVQGSKSHSSGHSSDPYYRKRKKESFLGDLFG